jgi:hypothetical protein
MNIPVIVKYINGNVLNVGNIFEQKLRTTAHLAEKSLRSCPRCLNCYPYFSSNGRISAKEKELVEFCKQYYPDLIENDRQLIKPKELDIVIPELKLAIEFNR